MKKIFNIILFVASSIVSFSQTISPLQTNEYCPLTNITFTVTLSQFVEGTTPSVTALSGQASVVQNSISSITSLGTFTFIGSFGDNCATQTFKINYKKSTTANQDFEFPFNKIKSLRNNNSLYPLPQIISAPLCQAFTSNVSFANINYYNLNLGTYFGSPITTYEYLLPSGWQLGNVTSTGNWLNGSNNVNITSDLTSGDNTFIRVRAVNPCGSILDKSNEKTIAITRPVNLSISGDATFCTQFSNPYSIIGLPPLSTVSWNTNNPNTASVPSPSNGNSVVVTKVNNGVIALIATVTLCDGSTRTVTKDVSVGAYAYGNYSYTSNYSAGNNSPLGDYNSHFLPKNQYMSFMLNLGSVDLTNITWTGIGSFSNPPVSNIFGGCSFSMVAPNTGYASNNAVVTINATSPCGPVTRSFNFKVTAQGWSFRINASPNPAKDIFTLQVVDENQSITKTKRAEPINVRIYNLVNPKLNKSWKFTDSKQSQQLLTSGLPAGNYVIEVIKGNERQTSKIVIL